MRYPLLGTYVDALSMEESLDAAEAFIAAGRPVQHVVLNAAKVNLLQEDETLGEIVRACPLINADGASILWAAARLGVPLRERVTGIDLCGGLLERGARKGYRVYLLGAREGVVRRVEAVLPKRYPGLVLAGARNGYFSPAEEPAVVAEIAASGADILLVALPSPQKERWIHRNLEGLGIPFVMGVGGTFDILAGATYRAPVWMRRRGLEWLCRLAQEPRRLWRRYLLGNVRFLRLVERERRGARITGERRERAW